MKVNINKQRVEELWNKGLGLSEISKELGIFTSTVSYYLKLIYGKNKEKRHIYKRRIYTLNEDFFENIDTEAKAYFLGLLSADGNLAKNQNSVKISLHERDKYILEQFIKQLNYTKPLKFLKKDREVGWNRSNQYLVEISSKTFRKSLEKYGLTPNKSLTLHFPSNIPTEFLNHYLRGLFDGDGCISVNNKSNNAEISIAGSQVYCNALIPIMKNFNISIRVCKHSKANCYYARTSGGNNVMKFYRFLYKDATIFLTRKKEKFDNWFIEKNSRKLKYSKRENSLDN